MEVRDLIQKLLHCNRDAEVRVSDNFDFSLPVEDVEETTDDWNQPLVILTV